MNSFLARLEDFFRLSGRRSYQLFISILLLKWNKRRGEKEDKQPQQNETSRKNITESSNICFVYLGSVEKSWSVSPEKKDFNEKG
jgi:hypothetical protein